MQQQMNSSISRQAQAQPPKAEIHRCLVTGGAGFLGRNLIRALLDRGYDVHAFDIVASQLQHERLRFFQGDLRNYEDVRKAMEGCDTVFHTAAVVQLLHHFDQETFERVMEINVEGTRNVLRACKELGVKRLIHTSSMNAIYDGRPIEGFYDETHPYPTKYRDLYSHSKGLGEQDVLAANGKDGLLTCAIRPSGIYGPGDKLILSKVISKFADGMVPVLLGDGKALSENSFVDNVIEGELKAADRLVPGSQVCGQAYFINDGKYLNNLEYFRPIIEALGLRFPKMRVSPKPLLLLATVSELLSKYLKIGPPKLLIMEVAKLTVNQPVSIEKAQRELGYGPEVSYDEAMRRCIPYCREILENRETVDRPAWGWWVSIVGGLLAFGVVAYCDPVWNAWSQHVLGFIPRFFYQVGFLAAVLTHVHKGQNAVRIAERAGLHETSMGWGWQTFILGFPSMGMLRKRIERIERQVQT